VELALFKILSKYPFVFEGEFHETVELKQNNTCLKKCDERDCLWHLKNKESLSEYVCSKGFNALLFKVGELKVILNGLIYENNTQIDKARKNSRKEWIVNRSAVLIFCNKIEEVQRRLLERTSETTLQNFAMFHDFKTSMNIIFSCTQDIINELPGDTFEEKLEQSDRPFRDLFNALELISSQLGMIDVILNPASISFGNKHEINIYKLFYKIKLLFEHLAKQKNGISIELINVDGLYIRNSLCYESIEFIPLILIDNALKYSSPGSTIKIELIQFYNKVKVKVKSIGPFVSEENREKIFEKFFRDRSAIEFCREGIGIGLWIAQEILKTHGSKMSYFKDIYAIGNIGLNIFEFDLESVPLNGL
jgi:K+-sensing histidine kinase KdpD